MTKTQAWIARTAGTLFVLYGVLILAIEPWYYRGTAENTVSHAPIVGFLFVAAGVFALWKGFGKVE